MIFEREGSGAQEHGGQLEPPLITPETDGRYFRRGSLHRGYYSTVRKNRDETKFPRRFSPGILLSRFRSVGFRLLVLLPLSPPFYFPAVRI